MPDLRLWEWQERGPEGEPILRDRFLEESGPSRFLSDIKGKGVLDIEELRRGLLVKAYSHVGRVRVDDLTITIQPKIAPRELLKLVRYAYGLRDLRLFATAEYQSGDSLFQDLLAAQLLVEVRELIGGGISRHYVEVNAELSTPRGRIDFGALASRPNWNRATVPCRENPRSTDNLLNRVLRAGVDLAAEAAQERTLRYDLKRVLAELCEIAGPMELTETALVQANRAVTRATTAYGPALRLIEFLLLSRRTSLDGEGSVRLPGFLFDMNRFFQELVARFLRDFSGSLQVSEEHSLTGLMRYQPSHNPRGRRSPLPRPDFTIRDGDKLVTFLDAKYRDLWERDLPREMLYQLAMYALSHGSVGRAAIVYPSHTGIAREAVIEISDMEGSTSRAQVALRPFDLSAVARIVEDRDQAAGESLARALVYGA